MKTSRLMGIGAALIVAVVAWYWFGGRDFFPTPGAADYTSVTFSIEGEEVTFVDGRAESPAAPNSATIVETKYFGNVAVGDVNADDAPDVVFIITQNRGGSGTFYYVVAALLMKNGYEGTNAVLLGDRIAPQTTEIRDGEVIVNYAERREGEPMTTSPSVGVSKYLKVVDGELVSVVR